MNTSPVRSIGSPVHADNRGFSEIVIQPAGIMDAQRDEGPHLEHAPLGDVHVGTNPLATSASPERMRLSGILRMRGAELYLEQQLTLEPEHASNWTTPRIYRLLATPATQEAATALLGHPVTVAGRPEYSVARHRASLVLDSIEPLAREVAGR